MVPRKTTPMQPAPAPRTTEATMTPQPEAEPCPRCGVIATPTLMGGSGPHACKAVCSSCGRFLRWISVLSPTERVMHRAMARLKAMQKHPPSAAQLELLQTLGDQLGTPQSMAEASTRIEELKQKQQRPRTV